MNEREIKKLLQLKKLETPGEEYFNNFLAEFQRYQRAELLTQSSTSRWSRVLDRVGEWIFPVPRPVLAWGTALAACVAIMVQAPTYIASKKQESSSLITSAVKMDKVIDEPLAASKPHFSEPTSNAYYTDALRQQPEIQKPVSYSEGALSYPRYVTGESSAPRETSLAF